MELEGPPPTASATNSTGLALEFAICKGCCCFTQPQLRTSQRRLIYHASPRPRVPLWRSRCTDGAGLDMVARTNTAIRASPSRHFESAGLRDLDPRHCLVQHARRRADVCGRLIHVPVPKRGQGLDAAARFFFELQVVAAGRVGERHGCHIAVCVPEPLQTGGSPLDSGGFGPGS